MSATLALMAATALPQCGARPIIDVHIHAYEQDGRLAAKLPTPGSGKPNPATDAASHRRLTIDRLSTSGVVAAIVGGRKEAVSAMIAQDPSRMRKGYAIADIPTQAQLDAIRREHAAGEIVAIAEVAPQYNGIAPDDPRLEPLWALAEELGLPVGYHIGSGPPGITQMGAPKHRAAMGDPLLIEDVLVRHPKLKLWVMHGGFPYADNMQALMNSYPNVYLDLGAIHYYEHRPAFHAFLRRLVESGFADRIMFGSDQMAWPDAIPLSIEAYREADYLSEAQKRGIFFDNALKFLGWMRGDVCRD